MVTASVALHFPILAVTWYVVVPFGTVSGFLIFGLVNELVISAHWYFSPSPVGFSITVSVRQIVSSGPAFSVTKSTTRTRTRLVFTQPLSFKVTVKVVVDLGKTSGVAEFGLTISEG